MKRLLKSVGRFAGVQHWSKPMAFQWQQWQHKAANQAFKKKFPNQVLPPDKWLFETFQLNYAKYTSDGATCAKEILDWARPYLPEKQLWKILDWGCGTARVTQYIHQYAPYSLVYGVDPNAAMIQWNSQHVKPVLFQAIDQSPALPYPGNFFHLVYGISVFTHLPIQQQFIWLEVLHNVLVTGGILIISTHGSFFEKQLSKKQVTIWQKQGFLEIVSGSKRMAIGDRNYTVYQDAQLLKEQLSIYFNIIQAYEGKEFPAIMGGQDLWILQKK